jgi:hypothetical protein
MLNTDSESHFRPYVESKSLSEIEEGESWAITDRYIPSRKLLKKDSLSYGDS